MKVLRARIDLASVKNQGSAFSQQSTEFQEEG